MKKIISIIKTKLTSHDWKMVNKENFIKYIYVYDNLNNFICLFLLKKKEIKIEQID